MSATIIRFLRGLRVLTMILPVVFSLSARGDEVKSKTRDVTVALGDVFIPSGFDSRSEAYVIASGIFPNTCYYWKHATVDNKDSLTHEIRSIATVSSGLCLMVLIPFSKEIRLGQLIAGDHVLRFVNDDGTYFEKIIKIE